MRSRSLAAAFAVTISATLAGCSGSASTTADAESDLIVSEPADSPETVTTTTDPSIIIESSSSTIDSRQAAVMETYGGRNAIDISPTAEDLPSDPSTMAQALAGSERSVRKPGLDLEERSRWGRWQQRLYHHLASAPYRADAVLALVEADHADVAEAIRLNWEARQNLMKLLGTETTHSTVPAWRIVTPPPAEELLAYYKEAEAMTGIAWEYVAAINLVETRMGRIRGVSTAGAVGPMQFLPSTWAECCVGDPTDPRDAIIGAATYLTVRGGPEDMAKAVWGYNNSDYYVNAVTAYADVMMADERAYYGYHAWQIYFLTTEGVIYLADGYSEPEELPATRWLNANPGTLVTP